jgi:hypothetical protein
MKNLIVLALVVVAGYFAYQKFFAGSQSAEQKQVQALADEFAAAQSRLAQAERAAGVSGVDTTSSAGESVEAVRVIKEKLRTLKESLSEEKAVQMADDLERKLQDFLDKNG